MNVERILCEDKRKKNWKRQVRLNCWFEAGGRRKLDQYCSRNKRTKREQDVRYKIKKWKKEQTAKKRIEKTIFKYYEDKERKQVGCVKTYWESFKI